MSSYVFPKVDLPSVGRSNHSLSKDDFFSFAPGTIRVAWCKDVLPKDHFEVSLSAGIESLPMLSPLYGKWKANWAFYFEPYSNIYGWMDNNTRRSTEAILKSNLMTYMLPIVQSALETPLINGGDFDTDDSYDSAYSYKRIDTDTLLNGAPRDYRRTGIDLAEYLSYEKVSPSSIFEDLGWPQGYNGYWSTTTTENLANSHAIRRSQFTEAEWNRIVDVASFPVAKTVSGKFEHLHIVKALGYLDIIRNYYANNQANLIPYVTYSTSDGQQDEVAYVNLDVLDFIFRAVRSLPPHVYAKVQYLSDIVKLYDPAGAPADNVPDYALKARAVEFLERWEMSYIVPNGGCFLASHAMDLNRGFMNADQGNYKSFAQTDELGRISMDTLYMQNSVQQLINILDITGGRFADWLNALWAVDIKGDIDRPIYLGSHTEIINTTDIVAPVSTDQSVAGQQTGFSAGGFGNKQFRKVSFNSDQYGVIYCIFSMVPVVMYSTGFQREDLKSTFAGIYNPRMANIGYQDVPAKVLNAVTPLTTLEVGDSARYVTNGDSLNSDTHIATTDDIPFHEVMATTPDGVARVPAQYPTFTNDLLSEDWQNEVVGRQVAWSEYMADVNRSRGFFAKEGSLSYWTLNRSFTADSLLRWAYNLHWYDQLEDGAFEYNLTGLREIGAVPNYTTYVLPSKWNEIFAQTDSYSQNFRQYLKLDVFAKRAIPKRTFPHM